MLQSAIRFQTAATWRNPLAFLTIVLITLGVLYVGHRHATLRQAVIYLITMWVCAFAIDMWAVNRRIKETFIVRQPRKETIYFLLSALLGLVFLLVRFLPALDWPHLRPIYRLATLPLILFVFPIGLAIIMLLLRYKPRDLGIRWESLLPAIFIVAISAIAKAITGGALTWQMVIAESGGLAGALFSGFIVAGLAEEFFRVIGQTRIGALLRSTGAGWLITTTIWALMHAPKWYGESSDMTDALLSSLRIIPIGLMWGYLTHRMKSILPAVLVHGANYWGLQNF